MTKQVFYDPQRKRWKRLRRIFDVAAVFGTIVGVLFIIGLLRMTTLPELLLATPKRNYSPLTVAPPAPTPQTTVSYTHLDVYKRQRESR